MKVPGINFVNLVNFLPEEVNNFNKVDTWHQG